MTDVLGETIPDEFDAIPPGFKRCAAPGCDELFEPTGAGGQWRKFCEIHKVPAKPKKGKVAKPVRDKTAPTVNFNMGPKAKTKDRELDAVEDRARQIVQGIAVFVLISGQPEDAKDIENGADSLAKATRELAEYEAWLRKLAAGGETSGRALAWLQFGLALVGILMPILLRHEALPSNISELARKTLSMNAPAAPAEPVANEPAAA